MVEKRTWEEFRATGLLWWVNRGLHLFGWALVVEISDTDGTITDAYPARVKFRGFSDQVEPQEFLKLHHYLADNAAELLKEAEE